MWEKKKGSVLFLDTKHGRRGVWVKENVIAYMTD